MDECTGNVHVWRDYLDRYMVAEAPKFHTDFLSHYSRPAEKERRLDPLTIRWQSHIESLGSWELGDIYFVESAEHFVELAADSVDYSHFVAKAFSANSSLRFGFSVQNYSFDSLHRLQGLVSRDFLIVLVPKTDYPHPTDTLKLFDERDIAHSTGTDLLEEFPGCLSLLGQKEEAWELPSTMNGISARAAPSTFSFSRDCWNKQKCV